MTKYKLLKCIGFIAVLNFVINSNYYFGEYMRGYTMNENFVMTMFNIQYLKNEKTFIFAAESLSIVILFGIIYGSDMCEIINSYGTYIFTREKKRDRWFIIRALELFGKSMLISAIDNALTLMACFVAMREKMDIQTLEYYLIMTFALGIITFIVTIVINFVAIISNIKIGFFVGYGLMASLLYLEMKLFRTVNDSVKMLNPISSLTLYVGKSSMYVVVSILYYILLPLVMILIMSKVFEKKVDIGM